MTTQTHQPAAYQIDGANGEFMCLSRTKSTVRGATSKPLYDESALEKERTARIEVQQRLADHGETWLTPRATDTNNGESSETFVKRMGDRGVHCSGSLASQASRNWMTPKAGACGSTSTTSGRAPEMATALQAQVTNWATPQARDHKNPDKPESGNFQRKLQQGYTIDLNSQTAAWESSHQAQPTQPGPESSSGGPTSPRRLNPAFTAWLMGWPTTWTTADPSASSAAATESWRRKLALHLSDLCGE